MATPPTNSYRILLANQLKSYEKIKQYIYLDSPGPKGLLTTAMGLLLIDRANRSQADAFASVRSVLNESDKSLFDDISVALRRAGNNRAELAKDFVIDGNGILTHFRNGSASEDRSTWKDIRTLIPTRIKNLHRGDRQSSIVEGLATMIGKAGYQVVAEGIETEETLHKVSQIGFSHAQGYLVGRPEKTCQTS